MEIGTDTTARIAADILMAALDSKAVTTRGDTKESVQQIAEAFTIISSWLQQTVRRPEVFGQVLRGPVAALPLPAPLTSLAYSARSSPSMIAG